MFHEALNATHHLHLFNYLAQLFTQAGIELPPSRQMKGEEEIRGGKKDGRKERGKGGRILYLDSSTVFFEGLSSNVHHDKSLT